MTKEEIKALVREKMSSKRIVLFGAGVVAEEFYEAHKDLLNISHCVSNIQKEWGEGAFMEGELDVRQYRPEDIEENDYIIVCGPLAFRSIELQLRDDGYEMYEDFVESKIAGAIYSGKKIALFYGQCILRDIHKCLVQVPSFTEEYASIYTQASKGQAIVINRLLYHVKDICDLYVYTPKILDKESIYSLNPNQLTKDCKVFSVSNLTYPLYWPQINDKVDEYNQFYIYPYNAKRDLDFYHRMYRQEDCNINKMVIDGMTTKEIINTLSDENFYSEKEVLKNKRIALKLIAAAEKTIDITVLDYIEDMYQKEMLYQNYIHPNKSVIWLYIRRLLTGIGLSLQDVDDIEREAPLHVHQSGDVPIYPSVAKHLSLEFVNKDTKYEILVGNGITYMTFEEYTEHFTEYTRKAYELMRLI